MNELHARYWILARTIYDAVSHSWRNPMTSSCHFLHLHIFAHQSECHYFIFFQEISMWKKHKHNHWKKLSQTITIYELFWYPLIFVPLYISQLYMLQWNLFFHFSQPTFNDCRKQLFELRPNELYTIMSSKFCLASQF